MTYQLNNDASVNGCHYQGKVDANYSRLVSLFGPPIENCGDGKVSGEWVFSSSDGEVFTLYDWKETGDYGMTIQEFRELPLSTFNIGGKSNCADFLAWLKCQLQETQ